MRRPTKSGVFTAVAVLVFSTTLAYAIAGVLTTRGQVSALKSNLSKSQDAVGALSRQVKSLGATPVAVPSLEPVPGPAGLQGLSIVGPRGDVGPQGLPGMPGPRGIAGAAGHVGATGPSGPAGATGAAGADGAPGKDGTNGADGAPGATGPQGPQGSPGPDGCTWQDDKGNPGFQVCTRPSPTPTP